MANVLISDLTVDPDPIDGTELMEIETAGGDSYKVTVADLSPGITGLGVAQGGTGAATLADHGVLLGSGTGAVSVTAVGTNGQVLNGQTGADPAWTTLSGAVTMDHTGAVTLANDLVTGDNVATVADASTAGGVHLIYPIAVPDGGTGNVDLTLDAVSDVEIFDVTLHKAGAAGGLNDTIQVDNGTSGDHVTNAMDINVALGTLVYPTTIDQTHKLIAAGGTIRIVRTNGGAGGNNTAVQVYISAIRRA